MIGGGGTPPPENLVTRWEFPTGVGAVGLVWFGLNRDRSPPPPVRPPRPSLRQHSALRLLLNAKAATHDSIPQIPYPYALL